MPEIEYKEKISQGWGYWVNICIENDSWTNSSDVKLLAVKRPEFDPESGRFPDRREWLFTPVFFPGEFHGQRSLAGYSTRGFRVKHDWATNTHMSKWHISLKTLQHESFWPPNFS